MSVWCSVEGCINQATEEYMDKETLQTIGLCTEHYNKVLNIKTAEEIDKERIKKEKIN